MKRESFLQYNQPSIGEDEINEVVNTLRSGWLTTGPKATEFEELIAEITGAKYSIAVNSCTAALHLSLIALDIGKGDEVITTPYTFASTGNVIVHAGAKPVFADIERKTYNIDPEKINEAINPRTKAIIPVHYAGQPCDMKAIIEIAEDNGLFVIDDAAHAIGAECDGKKIGTLGTSTCFSFYVTKNITTGEGGAITTDDAKLADKIRVLRLHGMSKDAWMRYSDKGSWYYEIEECGWKYNMSDISAALGIHQIGKLRQFTDIRRKYAEIYNENLKYFDEIITPHEKANVKHAFHLYPILLRSYDRSEFIQRMHDKRVGCSVHFIPLHLHPFYQRTFGLKKGSYPNAEWVYEKEVSLPLYPKMSEGDLAYVIDCVKEVLGQR